MLFHRSTAYLLGIWIATGASARSQSYELTIDGSSALMRCDLRETDGRVRMLFDLSGYVQTSRLLRKTILAADFGNETWAQPRRLQQLCQSQLKELASRKQITGVIWVEKKTSCVCQGEECTIVESHHLSFSPLKQDGHQHFYFSALGVDRYEDPSCFYELQD